MEEKEKEAEPAAEKEAEPAVEKEAEPAEKEAEHAADVQKEEKTFRKWSLIAIQRIADLLPKVVSPFFLDEMYKNIVF